MKKLLLIALCALAFTSCASIISGSKKRVMFDSNVTSEGTVIVDGRRYKEVSFPCKVSVKRGLEESVVRFNFEGYEGQTLYIDKSFNPVAVLNLTNIVGWLVDIATGAITRPEQEIYWVELAPKGVVESPETESAPEAEEEVETATAPTTDLLPELVIE